MKERDHPLSRGTSLMNDDTVNPFTVDISEAC
jgi:hypothetical protein